MFYNHNTNLNIWFVSPYLTFQRYKDFFRKTKSKSQEDGHDNEVNFIENLKKNYIKNSKIKWCGKKNALKHDKTYKITHTAKTD